MTPKPLPIVLYCYRTDGSFRMITAHYSQLWEARRFLEVLLNADPFVWEEQRMTSDPQLMTGRGIRVRGAQLEDIMAYDYTADTRDLQLADAEVRRARQIMTALPDPDEVHEAIAAARQERRSRLPERSIPPTSYPAARRASSFQIAVPSETTVGDSAVLMFALFALSFCLIAVSNKFRAKHI